MKSIYTWKVFVTLLGWLSDPFKGYISDLQLEDRKVTWNHLYLFCLKCSNETDS